MIGSALLLLASGFTYSVDRDPFTDAETYIAAIGDESHGPAVAVGCEAGGANRPVVAIVPGFRLYSSGVPGSYSDKFRFDDREPIELRVAYRGDKAFLYETNAEQFVAGLRNSRTVVFEMTDYTADTKVIRLGTAGAVEALDRMTEACRGGTSRSRAPMDKQAGKKAAPVD